jgi:hypothetical protein
VKGAGSIENSDAEIEFTIQKFGAVSRQCVTTVKNGTHNCFDSMGYRRRSIYSIKAKIYRFSGKNTKAVNVSAFCYELLLTQKTDGFALTYRCPSTPCMRVLSTSNGLLQRVENIPLIMPPSMASRGLSWGVPIERRVSILDIKKKQ